jgi:phage N-6-adenine-methyltransferase
MSKFYKKTALSSNSIEYETPQDLFNKLNNIYNFDIDVCATDQNAKCKKYFTIKDNGLIQKWHGVCFMNPPYGRKIKDWIKKAYDESLNNVKTVALIPARTCTTYWHDYIFPYCKIEFLKGRLKFKNKNGVLNPAPFPSAIVIFGG